jgi:hypothetical protein
MQNKYTIFDVLAKFSDQLGSSFTVCFDGIARDYNWLRNERLPGAWTMQSFDTQPLANDHTRYSIKIAGGSFRDELNATILNLVQKYRRENFSDLCFYFDGTLVQARAFENDARSAVWSLEDIASAKQRGIYIQCTYKLLKMPPGRIATVEQVEAAQ